MEPITADRFLFVEFVRQSVEISVSRQGVMKCGVEYADMGHSGEQPPHIAYSGYDHRVVKWCQWIELLHLGQELVRQQRRFSKLFSAVNNAMRDDTDFGGVANDACFFRGKLRQHFLERSSVIAPWQLTFLFAARAGMFQPCAINPDAFNRTAGVVTLIGGVVKRILQ